jgi:hypothetical protein
VRLPWPTPLFLLTVALGVALSIAYVLHDIRAGVNASLKPSVIPIPTPKSFESESWISDRSDTQQTRRSMVEALVSSHVLIGKTRDEVVALLGPGHGSDHFDPLGIDERLKPWDLVFRGGCQGWIGFDRVATNCTYVVVKFGPDGRVTRAAAVGPLSMK